MRVYLDTSAAAKLFALEKESSAMVALMNDTGVAISSSLLLETELRRFAIRVDVAQEEVTEFLDGITLHALPPSVFRAAGLLSGAGLRSLDALHISAAGHIGTSAIVTYDTRMAAAAAAAGMTALAPM